MRWTEAPALQLPSNKLINRLTDVNGGWSVVTCDSTAAGPLLSQR